MNDLVRTEKLFGGNKTIVGSPSSDLILESLGKIYIKTGKSTQLLDKVIQSLIKIDKSSIIVTDSDDYTYPGDGYLIYNSKERILYICIDGQKLPLIENIGDKDKVHQYVKRSGDSMSGPLEIKTIESPLKVTSNALNTNLNAEYLDGYKADDMAKKNVDEIIEGQWTYNNLQNFRNHIISNKTIGTKNFQDGYQGFGWRIDSETNTLTIDNIIVRKAMYVYELVINKIQATNGSLWVTNSGKIEKVEYVQLGKNEVDYYHLENNNGQFTDKSNSYKLIHIAKDLSYDIIPDNPTEYDLQLWRTFIYKINDTTSFENDGNYETINIYDKYFKNSNSFFVITIDDIIFKKGDLIRCQKVIQNGIKTYDAVVLANVTGATYLIQISEANETFNKLIYNSKLENASDQPDTEVVTIMSPNKDDVLVQYGNIFDTNRQGSFYITSSDVNSPYAMVISGANTPEYNVPYATPIFNEYNSVKQENNKYKYEWVKSIKVRLGKLDGQWDNFYLDENGNSTIHGWGLYGQDVYLTGEFHLNNGKTIVDFAQDRILMKFKNAGLEIKDITGEQANKQGIILTADQVKIVNPKDPNSKSISMFYFDETGKAWFNTDMIAVNAIINKNTINSRYGFDSDGDFKDGDFTNPLWALYANGNGLLAGGNIRWNTDGQLDIRGVIHANYGDISGMYLTASSYNNYYQYLRGKGLLLGNSTLILNNNFWDGANSYESDISKNIKDDGQDHLQNISDMFNTLNIDYPKNFEQWQLKMHYLKQRNYKQSSDSNFSKLLPYDNGILINNFGIKQKVNKQIFSYDSTILNITYSPVRFYNDYRYVFSADAAYNGYLNGAFIGVYNFIINNSYDEYKYIIIALDDVIDKNPELGSFLIKGIKQGNISIRTNYQPILVLDENKVYKQPQYWYAVCEEDENAIQGNNGGYGQFSNWELQEVSWDYLDHNNLPNVGFYQGYKSNAKEYHKYRWTNGTEDYRYGLVGTNVTEIQVIKKPTDEFKNKNTSITNWINDTQKFYGVQPWHNLFTGLKFNNQPQMFSSLASFRFQEKNNIVGEESPLKLNLNEDQFIFNCIYPEAITPINATGRVFDRSRYNDDYYYNMNYAQLFKGFPYNIKDIKGIWKLQKLNSDGETYSNYTLQQSDLYETINNYIKIAIRGDNNSNYGGFNLQIVYNE